MGVRKTAEERWYPRYHTVTAPFPGRLLASTGEPLPAQLVDVSRDGLGVLSELPVRAGDCLELELESEGRRVALTVVYCVPDLIFKAQFRLGLHRKPGSAADNLVQIFAAKGCIEV